MMLLAYVDTRPFLFIGGIPIALLIGWIVARAAGRRFTKPGFVISTFAIYIVLFVFVFAGPFVGRESNETFDMTWVIADSPSQGQKQAEVIFKFVEHPKYRVGEFSDEMAAYLRKKQDAVVPVTFAVTRDFGRVRGFHMIKVGELNSLKSGYGYYSSSGSGNESPW